jgi:hypothetical protein
MPISNSRIFYINSEFKTVGTNSNFSYEIKIPLSEGYDRVCVLQASIPLSFYLVQNGVNTFQLNEIPDSGIPILTTFTIPEGNYNYSNFMTVVTGLLNADTASRHNWIYAMAFDKLTGKYVYTVNGSSITGIELIFTSHLSQQFGFDKHSTNAFTGTLLTSTNTINFVPESTIYVHSDICVSDNDILQEIYSNNTIPYSQITYQLSTDIDAYSKPLRTAHADSFSFYITDEEGDELITNGQNVLFTLLLYKRDEFSSDFRKFASWIVNKINRLFGSQ